MADASLPAWISKRDGRLVAFEPDRISQALFAAGEALGEPNTFLARELTDGVLHFLSQESGAAPPTTTQLAELIVKVVRELGHPALAQAFVKEQARRGEAGAERSSDVLFHFSPHDSPTLVIKKCLREYSLNTVFTRDIVSAHREGLLTIHGLESPLELSACVLDVSVGSPGEMLRSMQEVRLRVASHVALDGPEYGVSGFLAPADRARLLRAELRNGMEATGLKAMVNLNCAMPPAWAKRGGEGPLFGDQSHVAEGVGEFLDEFVAPASGLQINWHLGTSDFEPAARTRLLRVLRMAIEGSPITLAFDRPRRPVALGEGLDRRHSAVLLAADLHLPTLLDWPGVGNDIDRFLNKLTSLARIALSAASQKRNFLRRQPERKDLLRGFFLDRARLVAMPAGLDAAAQTLAEGKQPHEVARRILQHLVNVLREHGPPLGLEACVDGPIGGGTSQIQLRDAGLLHNAVDRGTALLNLSEAEVPTPEQFVDILQFAWQHTDCSMVRLVRPQSAQPELNLQG